MLKYENYLPFNQASYKGGPDIVVYLKIPCKWIQSASWVGNLSKEDFKKNRKKTRYRPRKSRIQEKKKEEYHDPDEEKKSSQDLEQEK